MLTVSSVRGGAITVLATPGCMILEHLLHLSRATLAWGFLRFASAKERLLQSTLGSFRDPQAHSTIEREALRKTHAHPLACPRIHLLGAVEFTQV